MKTGYSIKTWKMRLFCPEKQMIETTEALYREAVAFYYEEKWLMFHVPVKQENSDARTAKERMQEGARVCSVRFTNTDSFAVCTVLDEESRQLAVKNCRGGNAYRHHCKALMKKVEASRAFTDKDNVSQPNRKYYMHLKHLNEHYAHQVSKEIMDFCRDTGTAGV